MKVGRDLAGFALPFAAGVTTAAYAENMTSVPSWLTSLMTLTALAVCTALLLHPCHRNMDMHILQGIAVTAAALTGVICGTTSELLAVSKPETPGLACKVMEAGRRMAEAIDRIGFRNPETNAVAKALLTGIRDDIPRHMTEAFRASGGSHILALSGLHLGIIYAIVAKVSGIMGNSPHAIMARSCFTVMTCGFYTAATGAGASITRAFLFVIMGEAARLGNRRRNTKDILMAALIIQLTFSPQSVKEVGFQLSYAAMAGIAFIYPKLKGFWPETEGYPPDRNLLRRIWNSAAMSISCQLTTGPLAWHYFGTFPMHFLLTNLIAMPLTGLIIPLSLLTLGLESLGICPELIRNVTEAMVTALTESLGIIASM